MARVAGSREWVEDHLSGLEQRFDSFPVNQTTISLPNEQFERVREHRNAHCVDAYVEVRDGDEQVLHVESEGATELPSGTVDLDGSIEQQVREAVRESTGIECSLEGVGSATIAGVRDEDGVYGDTLYRLVVVFDGRYEAGTVTADARWEEGTSDVQSVLA